MEVESRKRSLSKLTVAISALLIVAIMNPTHPSMADEDQPSSPNDVRPRAYLPIVIAYREAPLKSWTGMHMGNRNVSDWTRRMLAPFDPIYESGGTWPGILVVQSRQVFAVDRDANCKITAASLSIVNSRIYDYLRRASINGGSKVVIRITPSPGNFAESTDPNWFDPNKRPVGRTLLRGRGEHPSNFLQCNNDGRFRSIDDIGDEIIAIQQFVVARDWSFSGFEPANEPNIEWYGPFGATTPVPDFSRTEAWDAMDLYFADLYDYVHEKQGNVSIKVFTPPMSQQAYAETTQLINPSCLKFSFSGYARMSLVFDSKPPKNDGYSWHNYFRQTQERYLNCPDGDHISKAMPQDMTENLQLGYRTGFITESDLAPPDFGWGNPVTDKDLQPVSTANALRDFFYYEAKGNGGASRLALWLLNDDCNDKTSDTCKKHQWSQAYDSNIGKVYFRPWFNIWWFNQESRP